MSDAGQNKANPVFIGVLVVIIIIAAVIVIPRLGGRKVPMDESGNPPPRPTEVQTDTGPAMDESGTIGGPTGPVLPGGGPPGGTPVTPPPPPG